MSRSYDDSRHRETPDNLCAGLAASQYGLVSLDQARILGMTKDGIRRRVLTGRWERVLPRVYRIVGAPACWRQRMLAACLWAGAGAAVSHRSAAALIGLMGFGEGIVEISTPRQLRSPSSDVIVHRTDPASVENLKMIERIPTTPVARTLLDLGAVVGPEKVAVAVGDAFRRRLVSERRLRWELEREGGRGRSGSAALKGLLDNRGSLGQVESLLEFRLHRLISQGGLPEPLCQYEIRNQGTLVARVDFAYPDVKLVIEADGFRYHSDPSVWQHDRSRDNALSALGWVVLRFTWADVHDRPREVIEKIRLTPELCANNRRISD